MSIMNHPVLAILTACATTAACTWAVSEQIRVAPLKEQVAVEDRRSRNAPVISDVKLTKTSGEGGQAFEQNVFYSDPDGDAVFLNWIVLQTDATKLRLVSATVSATSDLQKTGTSERGTWDCGTNKYFVKVRVIITDRAGHASKPHDYVINCGS